MRKSRRRGPGVLAILAAGGLALALLLPAAGHAASDQGQGAEGPAMGDVRFGPAPTPPDGTTPGAPSESFPPEALPPEYGPQRIAIVGGKPAGAASHPWLVQFTLNGGHFCGGVLVHRRIVLTAAHCLWSGTYANWYPNLGTFTAFMGRTSTTAGGQEIGPIVGARVASDYSPLDAGGTGANDWALVFLGSPAPGTVVKIAGGGEQGIWTAGRQALVAGFGHTAYGGTASPVLKDLSVPLLSDSVCRAGNSYGGSFLPASMLCAGLLAGGSGTCQGDSGGPLTVAAGRGARRVVGLVSWGNRCALPNYPTVYARVAAPANSSAIAAKALAGAVDFGFTGVDANPVVVGSGATILACEAATRQLQQAQAQVATTKAKAKAKAKVKKAKKKANAKKLKKAKKALAKAKKTRKKKLPGQQAAVTRAASAVRAIC